jgi:atypical dual specificity phosphatase
MTQALALDLRGFGVSFGERVVLADVTFELPMTGLTTLVGPAGSGKSTLLRTLAGLNDPHPALTTWGSALLGGRPLEAARSSMPGELRKGIGFVVQHARFFVDSVRENLVSALPNRSALDRAAQTELVTRLLRTHGLESLLARIDDDVASLAKPLQRRLAVVRAIVSDPCVLFADEPTAELDDADAIDILALLRVEARRRAVLFVTHNQRFARVAGGTVVLLAGGSVREIAPAAKFWTEPATATGRTFVSTGGAAMASPGARAEDLDESSSAPAPLPAAAQARSRAYGPRNFFWVAPGKLGGTPRPGIVDSVDDDIAGLVRLGVTTLVTLEESMSVDVTLLSWASIASVHFPIIDMGVPTLEAAKALCMHLADRIAAGHVVAVHCLAGLGRTGTILAAKLIFDGETARNGIDRVRRLNPKCIQSDAQVEFLSSFEVFMRGHGATAVAPGRLNMRSEREEENLNVT